jgi:hypothetical protein
VDVIIPGHGPAIRDKSVLSSQVELIEAVIGQVSQVEQQGLVTVEEMQKAINLEPFRSKFTHDDKELNAEFQRTTNRMIESASREARDGRKWEY